MTYQVILAATSGRVSGVDVFSCNLARGLQRRGIPAYIVLTGHHWQPPDPMPLPADIPVQTLPMGRYASWPAHWRAMVHYLERRAPCIYIPNYDWLHSCVSPRLSAQVGIVGIVHSDDPQHYEHVARLGRYWNAIVAVSQTVAERTAALDPSLAPRLLTIPYGVAVPPQLPARQSAENAPLKIVYAGRLVQEQKRVLDLPRIARALADQGAPFVLTFIGGGEDAEQVRAACAELEVQAHCRFLGILPNDQVLQVLAQSDVFILTSEYEGLPVSLLEAMGQGCVPVVTDIRSGIPEVVQDGANGYRLPVGDSPAFARCLARLQRDVALRQALAVQAHHTIHSGAFGLESMVEAYAGLFERVLAQAKAGAYRRPRAKVLPPPALPWQGYLPAPVQAAGHYTKVILERVRAYVGR